MTIERFVPEYSAESVDDLRNRLRRIRWPDEVPQSGWDYGTNPDFLREVCDY